MSIQLINIRVMQRTSLMVYLCLSTAAVVLFPKDALTLTRALDAGVQDPAIQEEEIPIGVLDLEANNVQVTDVKAITERLRLYLGRENIFQVLERNAMESLMNEVGFQYSGACNDNECVVNAGRILGVRKMVAGSVSQVGTMFSLQVRIVDVESSRIDHQAFKDVMGIEAVLTTATRSVAEELTLMIKDQLGISEPGTQQNIQTPDLPRFEDPSGDFGKIIVPGPQGAGVWVDGDSMGVAPTILPLTVGVHAVSVEKEFYQPFRTNVNVTLGDSIRLNVEKLTELPWTVLTVRSDIEGAVITVDGVPKARTPNAVVRLVEGSHSLQMIKEGYVTVYKDITVRRNVPEVWDVTLRRAGQAQLNLICDLEGAPIYVDDQRTAFTTPEANLGVEPGERVISVKAPGYKPWIFSLNVEDGTQATLRVDLEPKSRLAAGFYSLLYPGWGQFYSRRRSSGTVMLLAGLGSTALIVTRFVDYLGTKSDYDDILRQFRRATDASEKAALDAQMKETYSDLEKKNGNIGNAFTIYLGVLAVSFIDAVVFMPRLTRAYNPVQSSSLTTGIREGRLTVAFNIIF